MFKSKTIVFNVLMGGIEALTASFQLFEPFVTPEHGVYLRTITTLPLSAK
jgi:hypothetical protein